MRPSPKMSVCLAAASVGLLLVFCNSVRTAETEKANPGIKELQQQRLAVLKEVHDIAERYFTNARISYDQVLAAQRELLAARLEYAETREDRIKACDDLIEEARAEMSHLEQMVRNGQATQVAVLKAQAYLLEVQIALAKAEAGK
jgi:outer membrane protein TolC